MSQYKKKITVIYSGYFCINSILSCPSLHFFDLINDRLSCYWIRYELQILELTVLCVLFFSPLFSIPTNIKVLFGYSSTQKHISFQSFTWLQALKDIVAIWKMSELSLVRWINTIMKPSMISMYICKKHSNYITTNVISLDSFVTLSK